MSKNTGMTSAEMKAMGYIEDPNSPGKFIKANIIYTQPRKKNTYEENVLEVHARRCLPLRFEWKNNDISLNEWYSSKHWTLRNKAKKLWHDYFIGQLTKPYPFYKCYTIELEFNSRLDPSNTITMIKLCEDALQEAGVIKNDDKHCCKGISIKPNLKMDAKHYIIIVRNHDENL